MTEETRAFLQESALRLADPAKPNLTNSAMRLHLTDPATGYYSPTLVCRELDKYHWARPSIDAIIFDISDNRPTMPVPGTNPPHTPTDSVELPSGAPPPMMHDSKKAKAIAQLATTADFECVMVKHDSAKPRMSLLHLPFLEEVAHVMDHGAKKYSRDNYMGADPDPVNRFVSAAMRHLWAFLDGEVLDPDSGLPHLAHAAANAMILHRRQMAGINVPQVDEVGELLGDLYQKHMSKTETGKDYDADK